MKKYFAIWFIFIMFTYSKASIIVVDNKIPSIGNYTSLQAAHDAAIDGDSIYVLPSLVSYSPITVTKRIILIGAGYQPIQTGMYTSIISSTLIFDVGSEGSYISGFYLGSVSINTDDISLIRNRIYNLTVSESNHGIVIINNYFSCSFNNYAILISNNCEVIINNNVIINLCTTPHWSGGDNGCIKYYNSSINIQNNILNSANWPNGPTGTYALKCASSSNAFICNNIKISGEINGVDYNGLFNNMCSYSNCFPSYNGNISNVDMNLVFADYTNNNYHLKEGSPALGAGLNGTDMGIYGGDFPFVDGGYPSIPLIYSLEVPAMGNQQEGVNVTIKARTNN